MGVMRTLLGLFVLMGVGYGAEVAAWLAGREPVASGLRLEKSTGDVWRLEESEGAWSVRVEPHKDYYTRAGLEFRVDKRGAGRQWVVVEFWDRGYGLITVAPGVGEWRQWGVARVNSGRVRKAVWQYDAGVPERLRVEGADWVRAVRVVDEQPVLEQAPLVEPALKFARHSERVSSVAGDSTSPDKVEEALAGIRNQAPLVRALGFNGVETYVRWGYVERTRGVYDWSYYDAILEEIEKHGLQWFPMLLAGSGYALPRWLHEGKDNFGFVCLEHGVTHDTQSIFQPFQAEYARKFIQEFGKRYGKRKGLLGIRLGPSGDYGEAQYPAKGPGYGFKESHTHIGYWAGDALAVKAFRAWVAKKYGGDVSKVNAAWGTRYRSLEEVKTFLPVTAASRRMRVDFADWYFGAMSDWCEKWAVWAREAMPGVQIHQSSGGWGPVEIGTDYSYQARSMKAVKGGMRLTNEGDDYADNFTITRMATSAARFYGIELGFEPGGYGSKRGVMARLYNAVTNGAVHLFYYLGNLTGNDHAIAAWLRQGRLLDERARPVVEVAALYPDAALKLDDEVVRYRWGSILYSAARTMRETLDFDFASEQMIVDGALERYKVLVLLWGAVVEKAALEKIDAWVRGGGTVVFAPRPRGNPVTVEGDGSIAARWLQGDTGKGRVVVWRGDLVPTREYGEFVRELLLEMPAVDGRVKAALRMEKPETVYWSVLENGKTVLLNFAPREARVKLADGREVRLGDFAVGVE